MSYTSGTYSTMHNLLDKIRSFLLSNGWSVNLWASDEQGYRSWVGLDYTGAKRLHVKKQAADDTWMYFNFKSVTRGVIFQDDFSQNNLMNNRYYSEIRGIGINGSTGYDAESSWDKQPGAPVAGTTTKSIGASITEIPASGANNYYIFQNGDTVVVAAEISPSGTFMFLSFGCIEKAGAITGGQFYFASSDSYFSAYHYQNGYNGTTRGAYRVQFLAHNITDEGAGGIYFDADSDVDWRHNGSEGTQITGKAYYLRVAGNAPYNSPDGAGGRHFNNFCYTRCPNHFNGVNVLSPIYIFTKRANGRFSYIGILSGVRAVNVSMYSPAEEVSIESDVWKIFPALTKQDERAEITNLCSYVGFAFLKTS